MAQSQPECILVIHLTTDNDYRDQPRGRFDAYVREFRPHVGYESQPIGYLCGYESLWAGMAVNAWYGDPKCAEGRAYGFEYGYQPDGTLVKAAEAERFGKGLKKASTGYAKLAIALGCPQTLGQHVVYLMKALGVTRACWKLPEGRPGGQYKDWRVEDEPESIRRYIDDTIEAFRQTHLTPAETQAA